MADLWDDVREDDFEGDDALGLLIAAVGLPMVKRLVVAFGGDALYIPKRGSVVRSARNRRICNEFTGNNHRELANAYNLTVTHVNNILKEMRFRARAGSRAREKQLRITE